MTREKAIELLNNLVYIGDSSDEVNEAIKMATEALKQADVLDEIEEEIIDLPTELVAELRLQHKVLKIINKYKKKEEDDED